MGVGLTNLLFCNPGTRVLEIECPAFGCPTFGCKGFAIMPNQVGYRYADLMGDAPGELELIQLQDFWVDMAQWQQKLDALDALDVLDA